MDIHEERYAKLKEELAKMIPEEFLDKFSNVYNIWTKKMVKTNDDFYLGVTDLVIQHYEKPNKDLVMDSCKWIVESMFLLKANEAPNLLPAVFIYAFFREYEAMAEGKYREDWYMYWVLAKKELNETGYGVPHHATKNFIETSEAGYKYRDEIRDGLQLELTTNIKRLAKIIYEIVSDMFTKTEYVYCTEDYGLEDEGSVAGVKTLYEYEIVKQVGIVKGWLDQNGERV